MLELLQIWYEKIQRDLAVDYLFTVNEENLVLLNEE